MNGDTQERRLLGAFLDLGYVPMRSPGSGTGDWEQPDVIAAKDGVPVVVELRSGAKPKNLDESKVDALMTVADAHWAAGLIGIRYKGDRTFYLVVPDALDRTNSGKYSLPNRPSDCPWAVAIPFDVNGGNVDADQPQFATGEIPPSLKDWLDALAARQQGFQVRRGVFDRQRGERYDDAAKGPDDDA